MKFWEALKEMAAGAVCERIGTSLHYRVRDGVLESLMPHDPDDSWSESLAYDVHICKDWRIVTPAPSEAKPENVLAFDPGSGRTAGRRAGDSKPAKDDPMTAFERIEKRLAYLESIVHGATTPPPDREPNSPIERALSRCEELRGRMENAVGWLVEHGQRLSALEKGSKPQGTVAAIEDVTYSPKDLGFKVREPVVATGWMLIPKGDMDVKFNDDPDFEVKPSPVAWPKGSLPWAETEAKALGLNKVRRRVHEAYEARRVSSSFNTSYADRHELDWEPCE